jgi:hypothetical protein
MSQNSQSTIPIYHGRIWPVGLGNASKRLNVSIGHLHHVLTGKRKSPSLVQRYNDLVIELKGVAA